MYRAVTLAALRAGVGSDDAAGLAALADLAATHDERCRAAQPARSSAASRWWRATPRCATRCTARSARSWPQGDAVAEGRDVGGVVWPEAELKIWLDAAPDVRARRRVRGAGRRIRGSGARRARRARRGADGARARRGRDRQHRARPRRRRRPHRRARARATAMSDVPADDYRIVTPDRFWGFWRLLLQRPFTWFFRMRVYGAEHVPRTGPAVIASNHIAGIDVVVLGRRLAAHAALHGQGRAVHLQPRPRPGCCATPAPSACAAASPTSRRCASRAACCAPATRWASSARARASRRRRSAACSPARR